MGDGIVLRGVGNLGIPQDLAGLGIQRQQVSVDGSHEQRVTENRQAAVHTSAAGARLRMRIVGVTPKNAPGGGVERENVVGRLHGVKDAVDHQRRGFKFLQGLSLKHPLQFEPVYILRSDLGEQAVALAELGSRIREPVLRLATGVQDSVEGDGAGVLLRRERARRNEDQKSAFLHFCRSGAILSPLALSTQPGVPAKPVRRISGHCEYYRDCRYSSKPHQALPLDSHLVRPHTSLILPSDDPALSAVGVQAIVIHGGKF